MTTDNKKIHTDIKLNHWGIAFLPHWARPFAMLARLDRPVGIWLLFWPCVWGMLLAYDTHFPIGAMTLFALGAVIMRAAGCVINDLWDRDLDRMVARTRGRPLASGAVSVVQASIFLLMLLLAGLVILLQFNDLTIVLGVISVPFIIAYPLMKRITWWPQAFLGLTFNFGALMGWAAISGDLPAAAWALYVSGLFWTLGYDTIYAYQDIEDDALAGIKSTARCLAGQSYFYVGLFYGISFLCLCYAVAQVDLSAVGLLIPSGIHFVWQIKSWDIDSPQSALRVFKSNAFYGALVSAAIVLMNLL